MCSIIDGNNVSQHLFQNLNFFIFFKSIYYAPNEGQVDLRCRLIVPHSAVNIFFALKSLTPKRHFIKIKGKRCPCRRNFSILATS